MDSAALEMTGDLAAELADNDVTERPFVDPRTIPCRFSLLKKLALSPAHYQHACQQPQDDSLASRLGAFTTDRKDALRFGSAVHLFLLGEVEKVACYRGGKRDRRVKAYQQFELECAEQRCDVIVNEKEHAQATAVANAIRRNAEAMRLLFDGTIVEQRIDWTYVGKACRSTPDARGKTHVADLKTAVSAEPGQFIRQATRLFYHAQAWLYSEAIEADGSPRPSDAYVIAVEKTRPMPVSILRFTDRALEQGAKLCRGWIEQLNVCEMTGEWPEYLQDIGDFDIGGDDLGLEFNGRAVEY
ncbi:MAG: PD-(D/E)XK nuclease-like domain-containing protein [Myxococcota bacterium]|nr:PD-(D/E)XK nuclease-like domain-containing protein [Myxococcota bacterium]